MAVSSAASCGALLGEILDEKENALLPNINPLQTPPDKRTKQNNTNN